MSNLLLESTPILELAHLLSGQLSPKCVEKENWPEIVKMALDHGVGGMLLWSLRKASWQCILESNCQPLIDSARRSGRHSLLLDKVRSQSATALDRLEIPSIWLKGICLAHTYYPEAHLRPMVDLDVLVPGDRLHSAHEELLKLGFQPAEEDFFELAGFTEEARHHVCLKDRTSRVKVDLHFRLLVPAVINRLDKDLLDWFWTQTYELSSDGPSFRALKPEANLLYLCAHAILQNQGEPLDLLHLLDLHMIITRSNLDWNLIMEQATILNWTDAVTQALSMLPILFGTHLPEVMINELQNNHSKYGLPLLSLDPLQTTRRWDDWSSAFRQMSTRKRIRLIWLTVFPPGVFLRQQYHLSPNQVLLPYYISHLIDGGREAVRALIGINKAT